MQSMIQVQHLTKWYGPTLAVDDLSFDIPEGQIVGFLGPNGAGKSTTMRIITGYMPPTSGRTSIAGFDALTQADEARRRIGYLPESTPLYTEMRVEEYLHFRGQLQKMTRKERKARIDVVVDRCGLRKVRRRLIGQLSKGNKQRVGLAQALLHDPPVLILDEPTAGLDPTQIGEIRKLFAELRGQHTIILSSHILPEVEKTADRVMIIAGGRIVGDGTPAELRKAVSTGSSIIVELKADPQAAKRAFEGVAGVSEVTAQPTGDWCRATVVANDGSDLREALGAAIQRSGWQVREMRFETASLEQFFIEITAQQARGAVDADAA